MLEALKIQVQQKVNLKHKDIILAFFQVQVNKHNEFCGCNYCEVLSRYVGLKKYKARFIKRYNQYEYDYDDGRGVRDRSIEEEWAENHWTLENTIRSLKLEKDKLKIIN